MPLKRRRFAAEKDEKPSIDGIPPESKDERPEWTTKEWLVHAHEVQAVEERGDHVSPQLVSDLFYAAIPLVEAADAMPPPPEARKGKRDDKDDDDKRDHKRDDK